MVRTIVVVSVLAFVCACQFRTAPQTDRSDTDDDRLDRLRFSFTTAADSIQTSVFWFWVCNNLSKSGVIADLQAMKEVGINRAFIAHIGLEDVPYGTVKMFSAEWWEILHTALKTAGQLGIEIGIFNSPGWSQAGGSWIEPDQSMRYLAFSKSKISGPGKLVSPLEKPTSDFQDVRVLAFPSPIEESIADLKPRIHSSPSVDGVLNLFDGDLSTETHIPSVEKFVLDLRTSEPFTARSLMLVPSHREMKLNGEIQAKRQDEYYSVKSFILDRSNDELNVGFDPYAPLTISFPSTTSEEFRIVFNNMSPTSGFKEISISSGVRIEDYAGKTLAKMCPVPLPDWNSYQWRNDVDYKDADLVIDPRTVIDLSESMAPDGTLDYSFPPGDWTILRTGMTPTRVTVSAGPRESTGLEVDKMNREWIAHHFESFVGKIIERIPPEDRKSLKVVVADSWEAGSQNWTDEMIERFEEYVGYDPLPFLPTMHGLVVGSVDESERFLWDLRRFVADRVAYDYVGGLTAASHKHGIQTWVENYGHWGFPAEFLQYGGQADEVSGEFWVSGELGDIENKAASSAAHIYGKTKVSAESLTGGRAFSGFPARMKQRCDRSFSEGINNTLLNIYIHQPFEDKVPGISYGIGSDFNRANTWFHEMDLFIDYIKRCNALLQQGKFVADVAYFIGEDAPKMTGIRDPELPQGYSFDYINAEVIEERMRVKDGQWLLPDGMTYKILVLPNLETMRPRLLKRIKDLVYEGGVILGNPPSKSPSLDNYPDADEEVRGLARQLWSNVDGQTVKHRHFGKGMVIQGMTLEEALSFIQVPPDVMTSASDSILFAHRRFDDVDIYFLSNQTNRNASIKPQFRVTGKIPEFWNPVNGRIVDLPGYHERDGGTVVPISLHAGESAFIVFKSQSLHVTRHASLANSSDRIDSLKIDGPWMVEFDHNAGGPKKAVEFEELMDWTRNDNDSIRYYSGHALYRKTFFFEQISGVREATLDLGKVVAIAKVRLNGIDVGGVWTPPYRLDVTDALRSGENTLEIRVVNNWMNRLIRDVQVSPKDRKTWVTVNPYRADSPLQSSGLFGPVILRVHELEN